MASFGAFLTLRSRRVRFQDLASWTRVLTCPCWPRHEVVELIMAMVSFLGPCAQAHDQGRPPPLGRGRGGGDAGSLLPGVLPPEFVASVVWHGQTRRVLNLSYHSHPHHTTNHTTNQHTQQHNNTTNQPTNNQSTNQPTNTTTTRLSKT